MCLQDANVTQNVSSSCLNLAGYVPCLQIQLCGYGGLILGITSDCFVIFDLFGS